MITFEGVTKRYGTTVAVDDLNLTLQSGRVTGLLGPNGAGKSTSLRMAVGLDRPSMGTVLIGGRPYAALRQPLRQVGALLDTAVAHPGRTAVAHLRSIAASNRIPMPRVDSVLGIVGLGEVAGRRTSTFSLGMSQRLGIAAALLGDPQVLLLDEPVNGLDPDGVRWLRELVRDLAAEGRTVCVSSHLMSEMQDTADHVVVMGRGRVLADAALSAVVAASSSSIRVRTPDLAVLELIVHEAGWTVQVTADDTALVEGPSAAELGELAFHHGIRLHELASRTASLEEAYLELTDPALQYRADGDRTAATGHPPREDCQ